MHILEVYKKFETLFNSKSLGRKCNNVAMSLATGKTYCFDIINFDEEMQKLGYDEDVDSSLKEYVSKTFGKEAESFIEELMKTN